jgi:cytoskeletal protein CcmA (bactofilin family)
MAFWKDNTASRQTPRPAPDGRDVTPLTTKPDPAPGTSVARPKQESMLSPVVSPVPRAETSHVRSESLVGADVTFEGRIEGGGSVRIAGKFKGDVNLQGDLMIDAGAKLTGSVYAVMVVIAGVLEGNIEEASRVDLNQTGVLIGDLKASSLTVAAGARMRGRVEFGWDGVGTGKIGKTGDGSRSAGS